MNGLSLIDRLQIDSSCLTKKKPQTAKKIEYVKEYVKLWLLINAARAGISNINFIDCMCNAGVYYDGDFSTSAEVLQLYISYAERFPNIQFNLFVNDRDIPKITISKKILGELLKNVPNANINIFYFNEDVNVFLLDYRHFYKHLSTNAMTILFVDPYDFGTVKIEALSKFTRTFYCELIFNVMTSDFVRNESSSRIKDCIGDVIVSSKEELVDYIISKLKTDKMKYSFCYQFNTICGSEIYRIIYVTPSVTGLRKLKEVLWKVFDGEKYYKNPRNTAQISLFDTQEKKATMRSYYSGVAQEQLLKKFGGKCVSYKEISNFIIERTMLRETDCRNHVIIPLIERGLVAKKGIPKNKLNYKDDFYYIRELAEQ